MTRNTEDRHAHPKHSVRVADAVWEPALGRAESEGYRGLSEVISGLLEAYAAGRLDAIPGGYRHALARPATPQPATRAEIDAAALDVAATVADVGPEAAAALYRTPVTRIRTITALAAQVRADPERLAAAREHQARELLAGG